MATRKKVNLEGWSEWDFEPRTSGFQVRHSNHSAMLPPIRFSHNGAAVKIMMLISSWLANHGQQKRTIK